MDLELPRNQDSMKGIKNIFTNFEIVLFLVMMFVCGSMYGFVETFLFVFLKVSYRVHLIEFLLTNYPIINFRLVRATSL